MISDTRCLKNIWTVGVFFFIPLLSAYSIIVIVSCINLFIYFYGDVMCTVHFGQIFHLLLLLFMRPAQKNLV